MIVSVAADARDFEEKFGLKMREGSSCTEMSPVVAVNSPTASRAESVGKLLPGVEMVPHLRIEECLPEIQFLELGAIPTLGHHFAGDSSVKRLTPGGRGSSQQRGSSSPTRCRTRK
jgi:hypothetical protein